MSALVKKNLYSSLQEAVPDSTVGISLAHLTGGEVFSLYGTEIPAHSHLNAHFHRQGDETYQVVEGEGVILLEACGRDDLSVTDSVLAVTKGDVFTIPALTAHQLINPGPSPLIMIFGCPQSHITTDRERVDDMESKLEGEVSCLL